VQSQPTLEALALLLGGAGPAQEQALAAIFAELRFIAYADIESGEEALRSFEAAASKPSSAEWPPAGPVQPLVLTAGLAPTPSEHRHSTGELNVHPVTSRADILAAMTTRMATLSSDLSHTREQYVEALSRLGQGASSQKAAHVSVADGTDKELDDLLALLMD
jgi:hypothetical protein